MSQVQGPWDTDFRSCVKSQFDFVTGLVLSIENANSKGHLTFAGLLMVGLPVGLLPSFFLQLRRSTYMRDNKALLQSNSLPTAAHADEQMLISCNQSKRGPKQGPASKFKCSTFEAPFR